MVEVTEVLAQPPSNMETANRLASVGRSIVKVLKVSEAIMFPDCDKTVSRARLLVRSGGAGFTELD